MPKPTHSKLKLIADELWHHFPATLTGVLSAVILLGVVQYIFIGMLNLDTKIIFHRFFHVFHGSHIYLSAIATTAIFYRHEKKLLRTILVGFFVTIIPCSISDVLLPYAGGYLLGAQMHFHLCLLEEPLLVLSSNALGILTGIFFEAVHKRISFFSHGAHVFVSSFASLFYLVSFGMGSWLAQIVGIFFVTFVAVIIPCCSSDIVIPLSFVGGIHGHEHEDEHTTINSTD